MKALEKDGELTEDDISDSEKDIQEITDDFSKQIDSTLESKERSSDNLMTKSKTAAIIMDGNREWAKSNNLPISHGHRRKGIETLIDIVKASKVMA